MLCRSELRAIFISGYTQSFTICLQNLNRPYHGHCYNTKKKGITPVTWLSERGILVHTKPLFRKIIKLPSLRKIIWPSIKLVFWEFSWCMQITIHFYLIKEPSFGSTGNPACFNFRRGLNRDTIEPRTSFRSGYTPLLKYQARSKTPCSA